jgi:asparagine synthase (glutamine-hydrolysing)
VERGGRIFNERAWYDIPFGREPLHQSERDIALELHSRVEHAVSRQLMAEVPVGAFLSGGLDSSTVVSMMRRTRPNDEIICYCIGFAGDEEVEGNPADLPYATRVVKLLGIELRALQIQPDLISNLDRVLYFLDEPQADPAPILVLLIAQQARRDGIPVLLAGTGDDDIFSGYRRHYALRAERAGDGCRRSSETGWASPGACSVTDQTLVGCVRMHCGAP